MTNTVYICSSLRREVYDHVTDTLKRLPRAIHLRPWVEQLGDKKGHVEADVAMIHYCDELWVVGQFGRDCSWEMGYAMGMGKKVVIWRDDSNRALLTSDWMYLHGICKGIAEIRDVPAKVNEL